MLSTDGSRWLKGANRMTIFLDLLDHRFGKKNVTRALVGVMSIAMLIVMSTLFAFGHRTTAYYGAPIVVMVIFGLITLALAALPLFLSDDDIFASRHVVQRNYALRVLLSPAIAADRQALWRHRHAIEEDYLRDYDILVSETVERAIAPDTRNKARATRVRVQHTAAILAQAMGHYDEAFAEHVKEVERSVCGLELPALKDQLRYAKAYSAMDAESSSYWQAQIEDLMKLREQLDS